MKRRPHPRPETLSDEDFESLLADLDERERLVALRSQYTFEAIGRRYGLSHNAVWYYNDVLRHQV